MCDARKTFADTHKRKSYSTGHLRRQRSLGRVAHDGQFEDEAAIADIKILYGPLTIQAICQCKPRTQ
jgi:hypothetical protein